jgi:hypothetical protein
MKVTRLIVSLVLLTALVISVASCSRAPAPLTTEPDFTGVVTLIEPGGTQGVLGRIHAEWDTGEFVDKYVIAVTNTTSFYAREGTGFRDADFTDVPPGGQVQFWFDGPVRESFPMQATAKQVMILETGGQVQPVIPAYPPPSGAATLEPYPPPVAATDTPPPLFMGWFTKGGELGKVWNLADVRYNVDPDHVRVVVEMVETRDHVPYYEASNVDNWAEPFPTGYDDSWGAARIDLVVSDLYARESPAFDALPLVPPENPLVTRIGHFPTFDDASLGFSIGLKREFRCEVHQLTDPVRIAIDVWCDGHCE